MTTIHLVCPKCHKTEGLATVEEQRGYAYAQVFVGADGQPDVSFSGGVQSDDGFSTVGIQCRDCEWEYVGPDWATRLVRTPGADELVGLTLRFLDTTDEDVVYDTMGREDIAEALLRLHLADERVPANDPRTMAVCAVLGERVATLDFFTDAYRLYDLVREALDPAAGILA